MKRGEVTGSRDGPVRDAVLREVFVLPLSVDGVGRRLLTSREQPA